MISHIDHIVLTVRDIDKSVEFFKSVLGMTPVAYSNGRKAVTFGNQKINFNLLGQEVRNHAMEGSGDVCLVASVALEQVQEHLASLKIDVIEGPVMKNGAQGEMQSIYINDLDNNLIEISSYGSQAKSSVEDAAEKPARKTRSRTSNKRTTSKTAKSKPASSK